MSTNIFTTSGPVGVALRYGATIVGVVTTMLGIMGVISIQDSAQINDTVNQLTAKLPELLIAIGGLVTVLTPLYGIITKSHSDKAAEAAKKVDLVVPPSVPINIHTPNGLPDIFVDGI